MIKFFIILFIFLGNFLTVYASVEIREVMYNPEGSDINREWVEIYNNGSPVNIESWFFHENDTYHGLHPDGFVELLNGERALIVKDIATVQSELGSNVRYIKSSFSLSNNGETLGIANEEKNTVDSYTYKSDLGGNGDGKSLQLVNGVWGSAVPTPGSVNQANNYSDNSNEGGDGVNVDTSHTNIVATQYIDPYYLPYFEFPDVILNRSYFHIRAGVDYVYENTKTRKLDGYYYINFGDGNKLESHKKIDINYHYRRAGDYVVVFEYYSSKLAFESGKEPEAFLQKNISVIENNVEITSVDAFNGVILKNNTSQMVNVSDWKIAWKNKYYTFPRHSYILANHSVNVTFDTLGFKPFVSDTNSVKLFSNNNQLIAYFSRSRLRAKKRDGVHQTQKKKSTSKTENFSNLPDASIIDISSHIKSDFFGSNNNSYLDQYLENNPAKLKVDFNDINFIESNQNSHKKDNNLFYFLGSLTLMLGIGRIIKYKHKKEEQDITEHFGSIEIIE